MGTADIIRQAIQQQNEMFEQNVKNVQEIFDEVNASFRNFAAKVPEPKPSEAVPVTASESGKTG